MAISSGSIHVTDNSVTSINEAIRQLLDFVDQLRGLKNDGVTLYAPLTIQTTVGGATNTIVLNPSSTTVLFQDNVISVYNDTGSTITKGTPVYVTGAKYEVLTVAPADADDTSKMPAIGLAQDQIPNASHGKVLGFGVLTNIDTSSFTVGSVLYVSTTAGGKTTTAPVGNLRQIIGTVVISDATNGAIAVRMAGEEMRHRLLGDHHNDVSGSAAAQGDIIYASSAATPLWTALPIGTQDQVLTVSGSLLPSWADAVAGSGSEATDVTNIEGTWTTMPWENHALTRNIDDYYYLIKATDQTVNNSTTFASDTTFAFPVNANETLLVDLHIKYTAGSTQDAKFGWTYPSGGTIQNWCWCLAPGTLATGGDVEAEARMQAVSNNSGNAFILCGGNDGGTTDGSAIPLVVRTLFQNGSTGGTLQLQFAEASAGGTVRVWANSFAEVKRIK